MPSTIPTFRHVSYLWNDAEAARLKGQETALLLYRSNLLGADLRLTNYGGGNTSCKLSMKDPLGGADREIMYVKGSGGDLGTLKARGLASLYLDRMQALKSVYRGLEFEDEMVGLLQHCLFDPQGAAPSIDTPLHAFLPFRHVDHLHPDAAIAVAAAKDGKAINSAFLNMKIERGSEDLIVPFYDPAMAWNETGRPLNQVVPYVQWQGGRMALVYPSNVAKAKPILR